MVHIFRCMKCNRKLFEVIGGEPTTALSIKCQRCGTVSLFDYTTKPSADGNPSERLRAPVSGPSSPK